MLLTPPTVTAGLIILPEASAATLAVVLAGLVGGLVRGFSGFGGGLVFMPPAAAAVGPTVAAPLFILMDAILALPLLPRALRLCNRHEVILTALGALVGLPIGFAVLMLAEPAVVRWAISGSILAALAVLTSGWRPARSGSPTVPLAAGVASGVLNGLAQIGGPPLMLYWLGAATPAASVRANMTAHFMFATCVSIASFLAAGLMTREVLGLWLLAAPGYGMGIWAGARIFPLASELTYRRLGYLLIALAAVAALPALDPWLRAAVH